MMLNQVTGRLGLKLATPFELVNNAKTDSKTWLELFSIGYFNHHIDNTDSKSKIQYHTLDGIAVVGYNNSNSIFFITLSLKATIARPLSALMNQDSPSLTSHISSALMSALPEVYFETIHT